MEFVKQYVQVEVDQHPYSEMENNVNVKPPLVNGVMKRFVAAVVDSDDDDDDEPNSEVAEKSNTKLQRLPVHY